MIFIHVLKQYALYNFENMFGPKVLKNITNLISNLCLLANLQDQFCIYPSIMVEWPHLMSQCSSNKTLSFCHNY